MPTPNSIPVDKLVRLIGTPGCPVLLDVRTDADFAADPCLIPSAVRRPWADVASWAGTLAGRSAIVICLRGQKLSHGVAAWLRQEGVPAESLEGGTEAWR